MFNKFIEFVYLFSFLFNGLFDHKLFMKLFKVKTHLEFKFIL